MSSVLSRLVAASRRHAVALVAVVALLAGLGAWYCVGHAAIDTDTGKLLSPDLPWRRREAALDHDFPQNANLLAVVVDGATPDAAGDAADELARRLAARPATFRNVREPGGGPFFRTHGLLFLSRAEVQQFADSLIAAQPLLGTVAADPSLRGVFDTIDLLGQGVTHGDIPAGQLHPLFAALTKSVNAAVAGRTAPLSWQTLLTGRKPSPRELRRFVLAQPALDYADVEPGRKAVDTIHAIIRQQGWNGTSGVRMRVTGDAALNDDQLSALSEGAGWTAALSLGLLGFWLILAFRSLRTVAAILATLLAGLIFCAAFAIRFRGAFNPISLAFAPLFIGIAIDFGIQFCARYQAARCQADDAASARFAAATIGPPLLVAGLATAAGFLAFVPTDYVGVSDLGLIAGAGMFIAVLLNLTFLPALLALLHPPGRPDAAGFAWAAPLDRFVATRRRLIAGLVAALAASSAVALGWLRFDFNPIHLQNPHAESVSTLYDLMADPQTTPYTIKILVDSPAAAQKLSDRLSALPEVSQVLSAASFVPDDQTAKLAILDDARTLLGPTLSPAVVKPPPTDAAILAAAQRCAARIAAIAATGDAPARRFAAALRTALAQPARDIIPRLDANLTANLPRRLDDLRLALDAGPVSLASLSPEIKRDWIGRDGRYCLEVYPRGDARDNAVLHRFTAAVRRLAPDATGMPIGIQESARTISTAFARAGLIAILAITALLALVLRRVRDVALVLVPLLLAGLLTLAIGVVAGLPLNFANIIALPLLLGIGVAFDIYFVMRWRAGEDRPLQSSTARGVVFSALTTGTAFGSLALSHSPGLADMGKLLSLALACTLACTWLVLPALLGPPPPPDPAAVS